MQQLNSLSLAKSLSKQADIQVMGPFSERQSTRPYDHGLGQMSSQSKHHKNEVSEFKCAHYREGRPI